MNGLNFPYPAKYCDKIICVTNREICEKRGRSLPEQVKRVLEAGVKRVILREKDLSIGEYTALAAEIAKICDEYGGELVIHSFPEAARAVGIDRLHLPLHLMTRELAGEFGEVGCSVHSIEEARAAEGLGARYIVAGHIFATGCKRGVPPRGLDFLRKVCQSVSIPVCAIGGITPDNIAAALEAGAAGCCVMSGLMGIG